MCACLRRAGALNEQLKEREKAERRGQNTVHSTEGKASQRVCSHAPHDQDEAEWWFESRLALHSVYATAGARHSSVTATGSPERDHRSAASPSDRTEPAKR